MYYSTEDPSTHTTVTIKDKTMKADLPNALTEISSDVLNAIRAVEAAKSTRTFFICCTVIACVTVLAWRFAS